MKRTVIFMMMCLGMIITSTKTFAQAEIQFQNTTMSMGTFSEKNPKQTCVFKFKNIGDKPLVINQAVASCGCTVPTYTKDAVAPGGEGEIKVTYDGSGKFPGHFKKSITIRTNGKVEMVRLYIEGDMEAAK